jgi:hypothetical protein
MTSITIISLQSNNVNLASLSNFDSISLKQGYCKPRLSRRKTAHQVVGRLQSKVDLNIAQLYLP